MDNDNNIVDLRAAREEKELPTDPKKREELGPDEMPDMEKVMAYAMKDSKDWKNALILIETNNGEFEVRTTDRDPKHLLYMMELFKHNFIFG